ncbi:MAG: hypothetical protein AAFV53_15765 [Myxococcota bacterium]
MKPIDPIFDRTVPLEAPEDGYELVSHGALGALHRQSREQAQVVRSQQKLNDDPAPIYGEVRGIKLMLSALMLKFHYGDVRAAMAQSLNAQYHDEHKPFIDPTRPEGQTHIVNDDEIVLSAPGEKQDKRRFEWTTNLY